MGFNKLISNILGRFDRHYTDSDIFFLIIPEEMNADQVRLLDKIISYGFKKYSPNDNKHTKCKCLYIYEKPITTRFWQREKDARYLLKATIFKSIINDRYIPVVFVKDLKTGKEFSPMKVSNRDERIVYAALDKMIGDLEDMGVVTIADDNTVIKLKERKGRTDE